MGEEILEWQYRHLWDYTREPWFPAIRPLGYWWNGTSWGPTGWLGGGADMESTYRKVFRMADLMRTVGADTYHRDWGWWDRAGDWNGPDFHTTGQYLRRYSMGQLIYAFIYSVDAESSVVKAHPDWLADAMTLDQSMPEVIEYEVDLLDSFAKRFGPFQWRNDSIPIAARGGDDTVLLGQEQGMLEVIRRFLDAHPECAFMGVNGGGMCLNWEYLRYASSFQFTDGQAGALADYYASYLFPPDKINNMPDIWDPAKYDPATWRGLLCSNFDFSGDTFEPAKVEGIRLICDIYHYLEARKVVGWGVRVYHPTIVGDDETMYLERLSRDRSAGIIITKHQIPGTVTIHPKGLDPKREYEVSFQESVEIYRAHGAELMAKGVTLADPARGELIYLNLTDHPGNHVDKTPPKPPTEVLVRAGHNMGQPGVDVTWHPASDDSWLSGYIILRGGVEIDRISARGGKTNYYFDHSAGADPALEYQLIAVDGAGNRSTAAGAPVSKVAPRLVFDDVAPELVYAGNWTRETGFVPAHGGTLSSAEDAGATMTVKVHGREVRLHSRVGAAGGFARISLDGVPVTTVDCYTADEIPGWTLFDHKWDEAGDHVLRVEVLGQHSERSKGTRVWIDGVSVAE
jgi:hypothetical protein